MNRISRIRLTTATATGLFSFLLYAVTLSPSLDFIDAGELAAVAHTFGVAHPTGYPLFTMLAGLWSFLPLGSGIVRLNVFAALCAAIGVGFFTDALWRLLGLKARKKPSQKKTPPPAISDSGRITAAVFGALVIALSRTYWRTALSIEVYALHMLLLALLLWSLSKVFLLLQEKQTESAALRKQFFIVAFFLGLSFANHMSTVFALPAILFLAWKVLQTSRLGFRGIILTFIAFIVGLLPYLYLPLRASVQPWLNWGNPQDWEHFFRHISGRQYSVWMFSSAEAWKTQFAHITSILAGDVKYLALVVAATGIAVYFRRDKTVGYFLLLLFLTCIIWAAGYDIHDIDSYLLLAIVVLGVWASAGVTVIAQWLKKALPIRITNPVLLGVVFLLPFLFNAAEVSQHNNYLVEDYTKNMFASFEKDALVLSYQWDYWVSASLYYQAVENYRSDVVILDKELFRRSWYLDQLQANYPDVYERSATEIAAFEEELLKFERELPYNPVTIEAAFNRLINSFIDKNYPLRPVYVTIEMEQQFAEDYVRVPVGLAFRLYKPEDVPSYDALPSPQLDYRHFDSDERLPLALRGMYGSMLMNQAVYAHNAERYEKAQPLFERAAEFIPGDIRLQEWKHRNEQALQKSETELSDAEASSPGSEIQGH